jgi:hypothetical protein
VETCVSKTNVFETRGRLGLRGAADDPGRAKLVDHRAEVVARGDLSLLVIDRTALGERGEDAIGFGAGVHLEAEREARVLSPRVDRGR